MDFLSNFLWLIFKDILLFFILFLLGDWLAERMRMNRFEKAWWFSLITVAFLTFVLWYRFGKILLWN